jgi:hypothetical protein
MPVVLRNLEFAESFGYSFLFAHQSYRAGNEVLQRVTEDWKVLRKIRGRKEG